MRILFDLMKNIFKDVKELKPILKEIITLEDDRVIRLFEYIVVNNDIQEEEFIEMVKDIKEKVVLKIQQPSPTKIKPYPTIPKQLP